MSYCCCYCPSLESQTSSFNETAKSSMNNNNTANESSASASSMLMKSILCIEDDCSMEFCEEKIENCRKTNNHLQHDNRMWAGNNNSVG